MEYIVLHFNFIGSKFQGMGLYEMLLTKCLELYIEETLEEKRIF